MSTVNIFNIANTREEQVLTGSGVGASYLDPGLNEYMCIHPCLSTYRVCPISGLSDMLLVRGG